MENTFLDITYQIFIVLISLLVSARTAEPGFLEKDHSVTDCGSKN